MSTDQRQPNADKQSQFGSTEVSATQPAESVEEAKESKDDSQSAQANQRRARPGPLEELPPPLQSAEAELVMDFNNAFNLVSGVIDWSQQNGPGSVPNPYSANSMASRVGAFPLPSSALYNPLYFGSLSSAGSQLPSVPISSQWTGLPSAGLSFIDTSMPLTGFSDQSLISGGVAPLMTHQLGTQHSAMIPAVNPSTIPAAPPPVQLTLREIIDSNAVCEMVCDQNGSRFIQRKFPSASIDQQNAIFAQMRSSLVSLSAHVFANWVLQLFFDFGRAEHKNVIIDSIRHRILFLSTNIYGCRVIQKAFKNGAMKRETYSHCSIIIQGLKTHVLECIRDGNGHHVLQCILDHGPTPELCELWMIPELLPQCAGLCNHSFGCQIMEKCIDRITKDRLIEEEATPLSSAIVEETNNSSSSSIESKEGSSTMDPRTIGLTWPKKLMDALIKDSAVIAKSKLGNYIIQHLLEVSKAKTKDQIIKVVFQYSIDLSCDKFGSNVVEKCLRLSSNQRRSKLVNKWVSREDCTDMLQKLMSHRYGNYVLQTMILYSSSSDQQRLLLEMKKAVPDINLIPFGKHILAVFEKDRNLRNPWMDASRRPRKRTSKE